MKNLVIYAIPLFMFGCNTQKSIVVPTEKNSVAIDTSWANEQRELHYWLMNQTQEVRDSFRIEFIFSGQEIQNLIDTLKQVKK